MTRDEAEEIYMAAQVGANFPREKLAEAVLVLNGGGVPEERDAQPIKGD